MRDIGTACGRTVLRVSGLVFVILPLVYAQVPALFGACDSPLGLESGAVRDDQFYATSGKTGYDASQARLNVGAGWIADRNNNNQYLQVSLDELWTITAVTVQSATYDSWHTEKLRISYSEDNLVWTAYASPFSTDLLGEELRGVENSNDVITIPLDPPITARYIAFNPTKSFGNPALRLELYGCEDDSGRTPVSTMVDGQIEDDRVWTPSQSPIVIDSWVDVRPSASLTIQAGVSVIVTSHDAGLKIFGVLSAHGTDGFPVLFSGNHPLMSATDTWGGIIQIQAAGHVNISSSIVRQAVIGITGAGNGTTISDSVIYSCRTGVGISNGIAENETMTYILSRSVLKYNEHGVSAHGTVDTPLVNIRGCEVSLNDGHGMVIKNWDSQYHEKTIMNIHDSQIHGNSRNGIDITGDTTGHIYVSNSSFVGNRLQGIYVYQTHYLSPYTSCVNITVASSVFDSNGVDAINMYCTECFYQNITMVENIFRYSGRRAIYVYARTNDKNTVYLALDGNEIHGHSGRRPAVELHISSASVYEITGNIFHDNDAGLSLDAMDNEVGANVSANTFSNTHGMSLPVISVQSGLTLNFTGNHVHNSSATSIIELATGIKHVIVNNNFTANQHVPCFVKVQSVFSRERTILANNNYWGTIAIADVKAKICDFFLDAARARVRVDTFYQTPEMDTAVAVPNVDDFSYGYNADLGVVVIGGVIRTKMVANQLSASGSSIFVNRSVIVDTDGSLDIVGLDVSFAENRGAVVYGSLRVGNLSAGLTKLRSQTSREYWRGFYVYDGDFSMVNTDVSNVKSAVNIKATNQIVLKNVNAEDVRDNFINALVLNGNVSITLDECDINARRGVVLVEINTTSKVDVELQNCNLYSHQAYAVDIRQTREQDDQSEVTVIVNSTKVQTTDASTLLNFDSCSSHFIVNITNSSLVATNRHVLKTNSLSLDMFVHNNAFVDNARTFSLKFCTRQFETNVSRQITISNNTFESSWSGEDLYLYGEDDDSWRHHFHVVNNSFRHPDTVNRAGISISTYDSTATAERYTNYHTYSIMNNTFVMTGRKALEFYGATADILISKNIFQNNTQSVYIDKRGFMACPINITDNVFMENSADGIIELLPAPFKEYNTTIVGNRFVNNTATALKVAGPFAKVHNNFFENPDAEYNLQILPHNEEWRHSPLNASLNYWGTRDLFDIAKKIHDASVNESLLPVIYRPYLGSPDNTDILNEDVPFISPSGGEVGGHLRNDVTLTTAGSPYRVVANIEVQGNATLTLEPGVKLYFKSNIGVTVYGTLDVKGTNDDPVYMLPEMDSKVWRGLDIRPSNSSRSSLTSLRVKHTRLGIRLSAYVTVNDVWSTYSETTGFLVAIDAMWKEDIRNTREASSQNAYQHVGSMSRVRAEYNTRSGIEISLIGQSDTMLSFHVDTCWVSNNNEYGFNVMAHAKVVISDCYIDSNRLSGVYLSQNEGGETHLISSTLVNNKQYALYAYLTEGLLLESCLIYNHTYGQYNYWGDWTSREYILIKKQSVNDLYVTMRNNTFLDNIAEGIVISLEWQARGDYSFTLEDNTFVGGNRSVVIADRAYDQYINALTLSVRNNTFQNNIESTKDLMLFGISTASNISIADNTFINNTFNRILGFEKGNSLTTGDSTLSMTNNMFSYNSNPNVVLDLQTTHNWSISENVFHNPSAECELRTPYFVNTTRVVATHNYWGSAELRQVADRVCGFQKTMSRSLVSFIPYYVDMERTELVTPDESASPGGELTGLTRLTLEGSPYLISRSVYIRDGARLEIEAGVEMSFEPERGIYARGSVASFGSRELPVVMQGVNETTWYGVIIRTPQSDVHRSEIRYTSIVNTRRGLTVLGDTTVMMGINVSRSQGAGITIIKGDTVYNFAGSRIEHTGSDGIKIEDSRDITISGIFIRNVSGDGISVEGSGVLTMSDSVIVDTKSDCMLLRYDGRVNLRNMIIMECSSRGVYRHDRVGDLSLDNCTIDHCDFAIRVDISANFYMAGSTISNNALGVRISSDNVKAQSMTVTSNTFLNNTRGTLVLGYGHRSVAPYARDGTTFDVGFNSFVNSADISLSTVDNVNMSFHDNTFTNTTTYYPLMSCLLDVRIWAFGDMPYIVSDVTGNTFRYNDVRCLVRLATGDTSDHVGRFQYNQMQSNKAVTGIIEIKSHIFSLSNNVFDNPETAFEVNVTQTAGGVINASNNWWGNSDPALARTRVFDKSQDPSLSSVNITPILTEIDCSLLYCNGHGECSGQDMCVCAPYFTGRYCSSCLELHWGGECKPCPVCQHGTCNLQTGACDCTDAKWSGYLCDRCSEGLYDTDCLPWMTALTLIPSRGLDKGGQDVHVWGHNFPEAGVQIYRCRFGAEVVIGTWYAWNHVMCPAPQHEEGGVILEVSPDGIEYTNDQLIYTFYATCPPGACGREFTPPRGHCLFGGCSCNLPWAGDACTMELLPPVIRNPPTVQDVAETSRYVLQLTLTQGSPPVSWSLATGPHGMSVDQRTGLMDWESAIASLIPYTIVVTATNLIGQDSVTWTLDVDMSYTARITELSPSGVLPSPTPIRISGTIDVLYGSPTVVPVEIRVHSVMSGRTTTIVQLSDPLDPTSFSTTYYPRADDAGHFDVGAYNPASNQSEYDMRWSVLAIRCRPSSVSVDVVIDGNTVVRDNITTLVNVGGYPLHNVSGSLTGISDAFLRVSDQPETHNPTLGTLEVLEGARFDLVLTTARPLADTIFAVFSTEAGTIARLKIHIRLSIRKPLFVFDPVAINGTIVVDTLKTYDVEIRNVGDVDATGVSIVVPGDPQVSLVSFGVVGVGGVPHEQVVIPAGGRAMFVIALTTPHDAGEVSGSIYVYSEQLTPATVNFNFYRTPERRLNFKVLVEDEYTYFASGRPLVSGAKVTLTNPTRGYMETRVTSDAGYVVFDDVYEDRYTIHATAEDHSPYSAIPILHADTPEMKIFLQRVAVKYTWTVTPTPMKDVYDITLDFTVDTSVPMPVVTIEPAKVNTIPYELGQTDTIDFTIANHGLIRADNLRFTLPTDHPSLNFESDIETIGSLDGESSIVVPVKVITNWARRKRNALASTTCGLGLLYDYVAGGTQTRSLDVTLIHETPGRPALPCRGGGGGGGRDGGGIVDGEIGGARLGAGSSMTYNPVTPLSCDCAKTLIKSCPLAYVPRVACVLKVADAGTSISRGGGDSALVTLSVILSLTDTMIGCFAPGSLSALYTAVRCAIQVPSNCDVNGRRRREVTSDVVNNVIQAAVPVGNFMDIISDIFGDEDMHEVDRVWYPLFKEALADISVAGSRLSMADKMAVLDIVSEAAARTTLDKFLTRWNNTATAWYDGSLYQMTDTSDLINLIGLSPRVDQYVDDVAIAKQAGFGSIFGTFDHAVNAYQAAEKDSQSQNGGKDGAVCAKARMWIDTELVLTGDAFTARLELENGESSELRNIKVDIAIRASYGGGELANNVFSIGTPTLTGISGVDGTGVLGTDLSGSAAWLMIPYPHAAPMGDSQYDVGGQLSYSDGTADFSVPLLPVTITVKPNPSLEVHYFLETYVQGDDALTTYVTEPMVPFGLAVMVTNTGNGAARALRISSAQPEIRDESGQLISSYQILGAHMGNKPLTLSLTVDFGDIISLETKTAIWSLTSTYSGTFSKFSATFEDINPLGDPHLSLFDEVRYHDLIHMVRIDNTGNADDVDDFLVNDVVDNSDMPDRLYNSANRTDVADVHIANVTSIKTVGEFTRQPGKVYTIVALVANVHVTSWFYLRIENNLTSPLPEDNIYLLRVTRVDDGKELIVDKNVWLTTHIQDTFFLHLLDFFQNDTNDVISLGYTLTFGPRNTYTPVFSERSYFNTVSFLTPVHVQVLKVSASDGDNNALVYAMTSDVNVQYTVDTDGTVRVSRWPLSEVVMVEFNVTVTDDGIPARTATVLVTLVVTRQPYISTTGAANVSVSTESSTTPTSSTTLTPSTTPTPSTSPTSSTTPTPSTSPTSSTTPTPSTTSRNGTEAAQDDDIESWIIPTAAGAGGFVVLVTVIVFCICLLRRHGQPFGMRRNSYTIS